MSRSGYSYDYEGFNLWQAIVTRSLKSKRGQKALQDILTALDAMPEKKLITNSFACSDGLCTLGVLAHHRGVDVQDLEPEYCHEWGSDPVDRDRASERFDISGAMVAEIMHENDEGSFQPETDEQRWSRMRKWVARQLESANGG
ncbi:MAG: hypothetical protein ACE5NA_13390 [Nitrospiraceae bacterium]